VSVILVRLEFARLIFEDDSNIKFHENPFIGSRELFDEDRLTDGTGRDGHEEANGHFPEIFNAPKTLCSLSERFFLLLISLVSPVTTLLVYD